jgi:uncharacterized protein (DUF924 family)
MIEHDAVLDFWFAGDSTLFRTVWFRKDATFDAECARFADALRSARGGGFDHWPDAPHSMLALIVLLDQLSRNLHRGSPDSFAADSKARVLARDAVARGFDRALHPVERSFVYLPFMHSEDLADQHESVRLFEQLRLALGDSTVEYAYRYRDVIRRFGRFPHRNAVLGRENTPEELRYLAEQDAASHTKRP